ncbi:hypothetical protein [Thalassobacillus devorans]|nr:hypothetical protein [Thalassobacillus devorans]
MTNQALLSIDLDVDRMINEGLGGGYILSKIDERRFDDLEAGEEKI